MSEEGKPKTYESLVNEVVANTTRDDAGKIVLPEGTDEAMAFAATAEIRRRDTQAQYSKGQQKLKTLTAENEALASNWEADAVAKFSPTDQARLEELKTQDPDAWRAELATMEDTNRTKFQEKRTEIAQEAGESTEIERRTAQLEEYNQANPDAQLTDDVIANDIPPRITNQLKNGEIQFDEFLTKVQTYLGKGKAIDTGEAAPNEPNFAGARGSGEPSDAAKKAQDSQDYNDVVF
jgi:hypothetical protein